MHPLETAIDSVVWAGKNFAHNLKFIPDDKLNWKPAPEANSALELAREAALLLVNFPTMWRTGEWHNSIETPTSREEAQTLVEQGALDYAEFLRGLSESDLEGDMAMPFGPFPRRRALLMGVLDLVHHHGQLAYLQVLMGDTQNHFYEFNT